MVFIGQQIDQFTLSFVTPLSTDDYNIFSHDDSKLSESLNNPIGIIFVQDRSKSELFVAFGLSR